EPKETLERLLGLSAEVLSRLSIRTVEIMEEEDLIYDHGYVYRVAGGVAGPPSDGPDRRG
ncbi:MAG: hypothetical protein CYG60_12255, partial [Actinobacteria bacterium]